MQSPEMPRLAWLPIPLFLAAWFATGVSLAQVPLLPDEFQRADVVAIGTGDRRYARWLVDDYEIPYPVLVDDGADAAGAARVKRVGVLRLFHPDSFPGARRAWRAGHRIGVGKRTNQLGATFVVGPGDAVHMEHNQLVVNGKPLEYESTDAAPYRDIASENHLGEIIERESGGGAAHLITYTPGSCAEATFGPEQVPAGHYFLLGDNRDHSKDSRMYGPVPRQAILGKVLVNER